MRISRGCAARNLVVALAIAQLPAPQAYAAPATTQAATQPARAEAPPDQSQLIRGLEDRLNYETKLLEQRLELRDKAREEQLGTINLIGGILMVFVTLWSIFLAVWSFIRRRDDASERKSYEDRMKAVEESRAKDYNKERDFYEKRAIAFEDLQRTATYHAMDLSRHADVREQVSARQQKQVGQKFMEHTDQMLNAQIDNVTKLGGVIDLVNKVFAFQGDKEKQQKEVMDEFAKLRQEFSSLTKGFDEHYGQAKGLIFKLKEVKALQWPSLSPENHTVAEEARTLYASVLDSVKRRQEAANPMEHAHMLQLMGTAAYYANNIDTAFAFLEEADRTYDRHDKEALEHPQPRAYTKHFLGVAAKSWQNRNRMGLGQARGYLEDAYKTFKLKADQFLTPITLFEVYSYIPAEQENARRMLSELVERMTKKKEAGSLDTNQKALLVRGYLLMGNLAFVKENLEEARRYYRMAKEADARNPFAELSLLFSTEKSEYDADDWKRGLAMLDRSLQKRETTTRMTTLIWACVAARRAGDSGRQQEYFREFEAIEGSFVSKSEREPYAFSPISKNLATHKELQVELLRFLKSDDDTP
jgi:tetratricopeptide (TPR) repeat protein